jgi:glycosyltransferase involved in cell wall biosynthesis
LLKRLLEELGRQDGGGLFTHSIVVADNDQLQSAEGVVREFAATSSIEVTYCVEPRQNIALARNKAIENTQGDFVALIDDDEFPTEGWLLTLFKVCNEHQVAGVLGPVKPHFDERAPSWVRKGKFYQRPIHPTGLVVEWRKARSGNVLLRRAVFAGKEQPFRPEFRSGEDQDFFRRMIESGHVFIWCEEAVVYEVVPPIRWNRKLMLKRALLRGTATALHPSLRVSSIAKSIIAVPTYTLALPFGLLIGQHTFMTILVKLCDHLGKLMGLLGINAIREPYVTD